MTRGPINRFPHTIIRASAGTGKTFALTNRLIALLHHGHAPDSILATTFTRKAAGEILGRILHRLSQAALDDSAARALAQQTQCHSLDRAQASRLLVSLVRQLHRANICTLDAFFMRLAGSFSLELGLGTRMRMIDEHDELLLRREAIAAVLSENNPQDLITLLRLLDKGETRRSVTDQIHNIIVDSYSIYLQSPESAWQTPAQRATLDRPSLRQVVENLASLDAPVPVNADGQPDTRFVNAIRELILTVRDHDWDSLLTTGLGGRIATESYTYYRKDIPQPLIDAAVPLIDHAIAVLTNRLADQTRATWTLLDHIHAQFWRRQLDRGLLRFDDITRILARAADENPFSDLYYRLDARLHHLLLDEFQDTSRLQWRVLQPIAAELASSDDAARSFFCVGDTKQAIYGWRGGDAGIFDSLPHVLPGLNSASLSRSYRSSPIIIDAVNRVFSNIASNPSLSQYGDAVQAWASSYETHYTARADYPGYAALLSAPQASPDQKQRDRTLQYAADLVEQLISDAPRASIGILTRTNMSVARLIFELRIRNIPASEEGGNTLLDSPAVSLIMSLLTLADHPGNTAACYHVARSPLGRSLGFTDHDLPDAARNLAADIRHQLSSSGYAPVIRDWTARLAPSCDARNLRRLHQLVELAAEYEDRATLRPADFVRLIASRRVEDAIPATVRVMTIHKAKGLQFDAVVLPDLDGKFPGPSPRLLIDRAGPDQSIRHVSAHCRKELRAFIPPLPDMHDQYLTRSVGEMLCNLYVAMTRPAHALYMATAPSSEKEKTIASCFSGILRAAFTDGSPLPPCTTAWQSGDPHWFAQLPQPSAQTDAPSPSSAEHVSPILVLKPAADRRRALPQSRPSDLEGGPAVDLHRLLRLDHHATDFGSLIHDWLRTIDWLDDPGSPTDADLRAASHHFNLPHDAIDRHIASFRQMLAAPDIRAALCRASHPPDAQLWKERSFAVRDQQTLLRGSFDRVILTYTDHRCTHAEIQDFKTDRLDPSDPAAIDHLVDFYQPQLLAYRRALAALTSLPSERIDATLLFLNPGLIRHV